MRACVFCHIKILFSILTHFIFSVSVIARYKAIQRMSDEEKRRTVPRVFLFGGKAAPGYLRAKLIIKLINAVAEAVNNDPAVGALLKVSVCSYFCMFVCSE